jgi:hypothetical protein
VSDRRSTKHVMRELGIYPAKGNKAEQTGALELDEFDRGYPHMTLSHLIDVVNMVEWLKDNITPS